MAKNLLLDASTLTEVVAESTYSGKVDALVNAVANGPVIPVRLTGPASMVADGFIYKADASNTGVFLADVVLTFDTVVNNLGSFGPGWKLRLGDNDRFAIGEFPAHFRFLGDPISNNMGVDNTTVRLYLALEDSSSVPGPGPFAGAVPRTKIDLNQPFSANTTTVFRSPDTPSGLSLASMSEPGYSGAGGSFLKRVNSPSGTSVKAVQLYPANSFDTQPLAGGYWAAELVCQNSPANGQISHGETVWIGFGVQHIYDGRWHDNPFFRLTVSPDHPVGDLLVSNLELLFDRDRRLVMRCPGVGSIHASGEFAGGQMHFFAIHTKRSSGSDGFVNIYHAQGQSGITQLVGRYAGPTTMHGPGSDLPDWKEAPAIGPRAWQQGSYTPANALTVSSLYVFDDLPSASAEQLIHFMRGS